MKLDPGIHIVKHLVFFGKSGVTAVACYWASVLGGYLSRTKCRGRVWLPDVVPSAGWWWLVVVRDLGGPRAHV
jgi:hypothetical protein